MSEDLIKVRCGQCDGQMRVRNTGEAVVCPHCSAHLEVRESTADGETLSVQSGSGVLDRVTGRSGPNLGSNSGTSSPIDTSAAPTTASTKSGVSRTLFLLVASYASAMTLVAGWLFFRGGQAHQLESLPDIRTLRKGEFQFAGFDSELPTGHTLKLGESQRFGDVKLTPVKVTREPLEFEHYNQSDLSREPTTDVLKLWLLCENVSATTTFPPYDVALMTCRSLDKNDSSLAKANTFLARADAPRTMNSVMLNYDHPPDDEWNLKGMPLDSLDPKGTYTTFVAASEEATRKAMEVPGDLLWRVQLRKGVHQSGKGVTTLVDVKFSTSEVN